MTSDEFKDVRLRMGLTQKQLGLLFDVPQARVSEIERGVHKPTRWQAASMLMLEQLVVGVTINTIINSAIRSSSL